MYYLCREYINVFFTEITTQVCRFWWHIWGLPVHSPAPAHRLCVYLFAFVLLGHNDIMFVWLCIFFCYLLYINTINMLFRIENQVTIQSLIWPRGGFLVGYMLLHDKDFLYGCSCLPGCIQTHTVPDMHNKSQLLSY